MATTRKCSECGASLPSDAPRGVCPICELQGALLVEAVESGELRGGFRSAARPNASNSPVSPESVIHLGDYELLEEIARGGMGLVYRARQVSLDRIVAVKLLPFSSLTGAEPIKRFRAEASAAAALQHPNIVAVHEVGVHQDQHYLVMNFVLGPPLSRLVSDGPLPGKRAARYLREIAEAVHYAHEHGILHRDLKPSNVLLDENDQPQVTDFGLAKRLDGESSLTLTGQALGSPGYMPPEQAAAEHGKVSRRSDVYGLGAILYHLLTGRPPFQATTLNEAVQQVIEKDPITPRLLNPGVPRDLQTICLKCLEKEPERRYLTARALAEDLDRFLNGEPIQARPIGGLGKTWRWCRRKPIVASLSAALAVLLLALAVGGPIVATQQRALAERNRRQSYASSLPAAWQAWEIGNVRRAIQLLELQLLQPSQTDLREFTWRYLWNLCGPAREPPAAISPVSIFLLAVSRDGTWLAGSGPMGRVTLWRAQASALQFEREIFTGQLTGGSIAFSPDGLALVTTGNLPGHAGGKLQVWDPATGLKLHQAEFGGSPGDFSPDGRWFALGVRDEIVVLDVKRDWRVARSWAAHHGPILEVRWSPDGTRLVSAGWDRLARVWEATTGEELGQLEGHELELHNAAFSIDGRFIATTSEDKTVRLWDATNFIELAEERYQHAADAMGLDFSPDGRWLASASNDGLVKLKDLRTKRVQTLRGHSREVKAVQFAKEYLAAVSADGTIRLWNLSKLPPSDALEGRAGDLYRSPVAFSANGQVIATVSSDATDVLFWNVGTGTLRTHLSMRTSELPTLFPELPTAMTATHVRAVVNALTFCPVRDGVLAVAREFEFSQAGTKTLRACRVELYNVERQVLVNTFPGRWPIQFTTNGARIAMGSPDDAGVLIHDLASGTVIRPPLRPPVETLAFSPDGTLLATGGMTGDGGGELALLETATGRRLAALRTRGFQSPPRALAFTPDGAFLVSGGFFDPIRIWDVARRQIVHELEGHSGILRSLAISPDGKTLAAGSDTGVLKLWSLEQRVELLSLRAHERGVKSLQFSPDGLVLASGGKEGIVRLWRAAGEEEMWGSNRQSGHRLEMKP